MKKTTYYVTASDPLDRHAYDPFYQEEFDDLEEAEDEAEGLPEKWRDDLAPEDMGQDIYKRVVQVIVDRITKEEDENGESEDVETVSWMTTCFIEFDTDLWEDVDKCCLEPEELEEERKEYAQLIYSEVSEAENKYDRVVVKDSDLWEDIKRDYLKG